jgi:uncharacterized protein YbbC (DUF1343 family)/CubicO group peptidase (beta-lactamase class C family)
LHDLRTTVLAHLIPVLLVAGTASCDRATNAGQASTIVPAPVPQLAPIGAPQAVASLAAAVMEPPEGTSSKTRSPPTEVAAKETIPFDWTAVDRAVSRAIDAGEVPGAVVLVMREDAVVLRRAYGLRRKLPEPEPMTEDTIFDLASLTKPVVTATAVMRLVDDGKLAFTDPVAKHLPELAGSDKAKITIEQLMLHVSGLPSDAKPPAGDKLDPVTEIARVPLLNEPGKSFLYSDLGFILLGELVARVGGRPLSSVASMVLRPLGMRSTTFNPPDSWRPRIAPTEKRDHEWLTGSVHDPRAARMGGVAGHAGLFSTADDLAVFAKMLLHRGEWDGIRILQESTVRELLRPRSVPPRGVRALGWDMDTEYSSNRGARFPVGGFGHTGFTGTSMWVDPGSRSAVIVLASRLHPDGKGDAKRLRREVATAAAEQVMRPRVKNGVDVLAEEGFARLKGKRVGLVTHRAALDAQGVSTAKRLSQAEGVSLVRLFSPEHGLSGTSDSKVADERDSETGLLVRSLYGDKRKPSSADLEGLDLLVIDLVDVGARFFTYETTLGLVLEAAGKRQLPVLVLDRPNPLGGITLEGPLLDSGKESFVGFHRLPIRHGLTLGELARLLDGERSFGAHPEIVASVGWTRSMPWEETLIRWTRPSPNLTTATSALLYPGVALLETTNVSVGRGTEEPFSLVGAPWLDGERLAKLLRSEELPGLRVEVATFTPKVSTHAGNMCGGVRLVVTDAEALRPVRVGLALAGALRTLGGKVWEAKGVGVLLGNDAALAALLRGASPSEIEALSSADLEAFEQRRGPYLIYPVK